jgi:hypothetical protein
VTALIVGSLVLAAIACYALDAVLNRLSNKRRRAGEAAGATDTRR